MLSGMDSQDLSSSRRNSQTLSVRRSQNLASETGSQNLATRASSQNLASRSSSQNLANKSSGRMPIVRINSQDLASETGVQNLPNRMSSQNLASRTASQDLSGRKSSQNLGNQPQGEARSAKMPPSGAGLLNTRELRGQNGQQASASYGLQPQVHGPRATPLEEVSLAHHYYLLFYS